MQTKSMLKLMTLLAIIVMLASSLSAQPRHRRFIKRRHVVQPSSAIGLRVGNDFKHDQYLAGAHFWLPMGIFWNFVPAADYYFTESDSKRWQFNGDMVFKPRPRGPLYFGGGVAVQYLTAGEQTDVGGNVLVGLDFGGIRKAPMAPYIQARWTLFKDTKYFSLLGGINFILR